MSVLGCGSKSFVDLCVSLAWHIPVDKGLKKKSTCDWNFFQLTPQCSCGQQGSCRGPSLRQGSSSLRTCWSLKIIANLTSYRHNKTVLKCDSFFINSVTDDKMQFNILFRPMRTSQNEQYLQLLVNSPNQIIVSLGLADLDCLPKITT